MTVVTHRSPGHRVVRTWLAVLLACIPILVLLLIPQLMRSRAGPEQLLAIGTASLLALVAGAVMFAPAISAWAVPHRPAWTPTTALASARRVWARRTGRAVIALAGFLTVYAAGQLIGLGVAGILPYVSDNPAPVEGSETARWIIHYPQYLLQALTIYLTLTLGITWYADRLRSTAITLPADALTPPGNRPRPR